MYRLRCVLAVVVILALAANGQSGKRQRPRSDGEIVAQEVILSGTTTLNSTQLSEISNALSSVTMHDSDEEVAERITYEFQQRGYFDAEVTGLKVLELDPLAKKKPVRVEADISEGPLFRLSELTFEGNQTFTADELRQMFPIHAGDVFNAEKIRLGLEEMRNEYAAKGFLNFAPVPNTQESGSALITVKFDVEEGVQFRMGELKFEGPADVARNLAANWELKSDDPYNPVYLENFLTKNRELLPEGFSRERDVLIMEDCPAKRVNVTFWLDAKRPATYPAQSKPCEPAKDKAHSTGP